MTRLLCIFTVLSIVLLSLLPVCITAVETKATWDGTSWESFDWTTIDDAENLRSLTDWLETDATITELFDCFQNCSHAAFLETFSSILLDRFCSKPEDFLISLAQEDTDLQDVIIRHIVFAVYESEDEHNLTSAITNTQLSKYTNPEAVMLMSKLVEQAEEKLGVSIRNPATGDLTIAVFMCLLLSGSGVLLQIKKANQP